MQQPSKNRRIFIVVVVLFTVICIGAVVSFLLQKDENQFGKFIKIQNYSSKVKKIPSEMRASMENSLYNTASLNVSDIESKIPINDAFIRNTSDTQEYIQSMKIYTGSFIVDIESIQQSYTVSYKYLEPASTEPGGNTVYITCVPESQRIFTTSNCKDSVSQETSKDDSILQFLPYQNFSFKLTPDATRGEYLVILTELNIPESALRGNKASKLAVISEYKQQVKEWVSSRGLNIEDFDFLYNYDSEGNFINLFEDTSPHLD